uniref:Peptidase S1 domain-containing protein n=1 Tax=Anopheles dirus TaxID=7168 RepID=A0A182NVH5_9DIPT
MGHHHATSWILAVWIVLLTGAVVAVVAADTIFPDEGGRYEHDTCSLTGSMPRTGICRKAADCPRGIHSKGERCEFSGNHAVVCCPERAVGAGSDGSANRYQSRISKQECENFERLDSSNLTDHISGLKFRAELGEFPFMALVEFDGKDNAHVKCGAALISKRFLLTAAHCTRDYNISSVRLGMVETKDREATPYDVRQIVVHPGYKTRRNDIALIEVTKDVASTRFIQPICLNTDLLDIGSTVNLTIMGWGVDANDNRADTLFKATVKE